MTMMTIENVLVLVHAKCMDGLGAAWAASRWLVEPEFIACSYGGDVPDTAGRDVMIFDFSFPRDTLIEMHQKAKSLVLIDHHKTAETELIGLDFAVLDMTKSGAVLAWEYLASRFSQPGQITTLPTILAYIQDRDLWRWEMESSREYSEALRSEIDFESGTVLDHVKKMDTIYQSYGTPDLIKIGRKLLDVKDAAIATCMNRRFWLPFILDGQTINVPTAFANASLASELGNQLASLEGNESRVGLVITGFSYGSFGMSWRGIGKDNDLPKRLAELFGGGGHNLAAGSGVPPEVFAQLIDRTFRPDFDIPKQEV